MAAVRAGLAAMVELELDAADDDDDDATDAGEGRKARNWRWWEVRLSGFVGD